MVNGVERGQGDRACGVGLRVWGLGFGKNSGK